MEYIGAPEQAEKLADQALARMRELGVVPTPNNFAVWFHYFSGSYPDLKRTIDVLVDNDQEFDEDRCGELFTKFFSFGTEGVVLTETSQRLEEQLASVMSYLGESRDGVAAYGKTLEKAGDEMAGPAEGEEDLQRLISSVVTATRVMERQNHDLEERLKESSDEVSRLQDDLEDMRREAMTDPLTGIANRKVFDTAMRRETVEAMESGAPVSLLMIDIDHFKRFNDTYGHQVGDQVLRLLAHTLTKSIKGQDTAARYGGEEFSVILPSTPLAAAAIVAENIRNQVSTRKVVNRTTGEDMGQITVSIGVAALKLGEPIAQFINRADQALYEAKRTGRDKVVSEADMGHKELEFEQ